MAAAAAWMKCGWCQVIGSCFSASDNTIRTFIQLNSLGFLLSFDEKFDSYKSTILEISKRSTCTAYTQTHTHTILQFVFIVIDFITSAIVINKINCTKCAITMVKRRSSPPSSSSSACRTFSIAFTFPISLCARSIYLWLCLAHLNCTQRISNFWIYLWNCLSSRDASLVSCFGFVIGTGIPNVPVQYCYHVPYAITITIIQHQQQRKKKQTKRNKMTTQSERNNSPPTEFQI